MSSLTPGYKSRHHAVCCGRGVRADCGSKMLGRATGRLQPARDKLRADFRRGHRQFSATSIPCPAQIDSIPPRSRRGLGDLTKDHGRAATRAKTSATDVPPAFARWLQPDLGGCSTNVLPGRQGEIRRLRCGGGAPRRRSMSTSRAGGTIQGYGVKILPARNAKLSGTRTSARRQWSCRTPASTFPSSGRTTSRPRNPVLPLPAFVGLRHALKMLTVDGPDQALGGFLAVNQVSFESPAGRDFWASSARMARARVRRSI